MTNCKKPMLMLRTDLDNSVFVSLSRELFCFDYVLLYSLSYAGSRDLVHQWPAVIELIDIEGSRTEIFEAF